MKRLQISPHAKLLRAARQRLHELELGFMVEFYALGSDPKAKLAQQYALDCSSIAMELSSAYASCVAWEWLQLSPELGESRPHHTKAGTTVCPLAKQIIIKLREQLAAADENEKREPSKRIALATHF